MAVRTTAEQTRVVAALSLLVTWTREEPLETVHGAVKGAERQLLAGRRTTWLFLCVTCLDNRQAEQPEVQSWGSSAPRKGLFSV